MPINPLYIIPSLTFGLGCWQMYRLQWKLNLIQKQAAQTHLGDALDHHYGAWSDLLETSTTSTASSTFVLEGSFDHAAEMHLGPRSQSRAGDAVKDGGGGLFSSSDGIGYFIITPFRRRQSSPASSPSLVHESILVNRGWVPRHEKTLRQSSPPPPQSSDPVILKARLSQGEQGGMFVPANDPVRNQWYWLEVDRMATESKCLPKLVDLIESNESPGRNVPIPRDPQSTLSNNHFQYAITWFGLSAFSLFLLRSGKIRRNRPL